MSIRNYRKVMLAGLLAVLFILSSCASTRIEKEFDEQNKLVKETTIVQGEVVHTTIYQYDADGNCSRTNHYDKDNVLTYYITFAYNSKGQVIKETQYQDNKMFTETTMQYDDKDLLSRSDTITYQGGKTYWLYFYDENNNLTECKQYTIDSDGDSLRFWDKYDEAGNKVSSSHYVASGELDCTKVWEYDGKGRVKTITEYDKNGNVKSTKKN